jgi:hypothetical protein
MGRSIDALSRALPRTSSVALAIRSIAWTLATTDWA